MDQCRICGVILNDNPQVIENRYNYGFRAEGQSDMCWDCQDHINRFRKDNDKCHICGNEIQGWSVQYSLYKGRICQKCMAEVNQALGKYFSKYGNDKILLHNKQGGQ